MVLVSSFAVAEVTGVAAPTLSGDVTLTFGVDLNNYASGFENDANVNVVVPLAAGSDTKSGEGDMYAEITISDIDLNVSKEDGLTNDASVSAKVVMGSLWFGLGNPDFTFNEVETGKDVDVNAETVKGTGGMSVGFTSDAFSASFLVASKDDWDDDAVSGVAAVTASWTTVAVDAVAASSSAININNDYLYGANATISAGSVNVPVYFAYDPTFPVPSGTEVLTGIGVAPSVSAAGATVKIPVDYVAVGDENGLEADPSVSYAVDGVGTFSADLLYAKYTKIAGAADVMDANFTYAEDVTDAVTSTLKVGLTDLNGTLGWTVDVDNTINLDGMAPYVNFGYGKDKVFDLQVGVALTSLIDMATVTLDYTTSDTSADKGVVTAAVKVEY